MADRKLVKIEWNNPNHDWPWFYLLEPPGDWLYLKGANYPDGSAKHEGDCFLVHRSDIKWMEIFNEPR